MIVHFDKESGKVLWVNTYQSRQEAQDRLDEETIWLDETMPEATDREGYRSVLYLREDGQGLEVRYEHIAEREKTTEEKILEALEKSHDALRQEGADLVMVEMKKRGVFNENRRTAISGPF